MQGLARVLLLLHLGGVAVSLGVFAVARPPPPARLAGRTGALAAAGRWAYWLASPLVGLARRARLTPDQLTWAGVAISVLAAWLCLKNEWTLAGLALLWGSACDMLDGELARSTGTATPAGAFLDSNLDRISEIILFFGVAAGFPWRSGTAWAVAAMASSLMVSYARARGEGLSIACPAFGLERPHRILVALAALLPFSFIPWREGHVVIEAGCGLIAIGAGLTAAGRIAVIHRALRRAGPAPAAGASTAPATPAAPAKPE